MEPSRHATSVQASAGPSTARVLAETGRCSASWRSRVGLRPRPLQGLGGRVPRREARPTASTAADRVRQPQGRDAGAEGPVIAVAGVGQHDPRRDAGFHGRLDLGERDQQLGPKSHRLGNVRLLFVAPASFAQSWGR